MQWPKDVKGNPVYNPMKCSFSPKYNKIEERNSELQKEEIEKAKHKEIKVEKSRKKQESKPIVKERERIKRKDDEKSYTNQHKQFWIKARNGQTLSHDAWILGMMIEFSQYLHYEAPYDSPLRGIRYLFDKIISIQIGHARGRPMMLVTPTDFIRKYYRKIFINTKAHCAIITKEELFILLRTMKNIADILKQTVKNRTYTQKIISQFDWLDLIQNKKPFSKALQRTTLKGNPDIEKKMNQLDQRDRKYYILRAISEGNNLTLSKFRYQKLMKNFIAIFDPTLKSPLLDKKFIVFHKLQYIKNEEDFHALLKDYDMLDSGIEFKIDLGDIGQEKKGYIAFDKKGNIIRKEMRDKYNRKYEDYRVSLEGNKHSLFRVRNYKELKNLWYWKFLKTIK